MKIKLLFIAPLFIIQCSLAQWSTSTYADSALYVCPGFTQTILTFDDGSSIICGALNDSRYAQKLDPYGYKVWPQPVQIMNTPGTGNDGISIPISDGNGGCFVSWIDYRGAIYKIFEFYSLYLNNAVYMQHIDKNGNVLWQPGGMQVNSVDGGMKSGYGVTDGQGGIILYMSESFYDTTLATFIKEHSWIVRYDGNGQKMWLKEIDTSTVQYQISVGQPTKLGNRVMIGTLNGLRFFDPNSGEYVQSPNFTPSWDFINEGDSIAFRITSIPTEYDSSGLSYYDVYGITKYNLNWDSVWSYNVRFKFATLGVQKKTIDKISRTLKTATGNIINVNQTDRVGGIFFAYGTSNGSNGVQVRRVNKEGSHFIDDEVIIPVGSFGIAFNGKGKYGIYDAGTGTAQEIDTTGKLLWPDSLKIISDPSNAYSPWGASDNNGGGIIIYWSTLGGIYAQHTGRTGKIGIITKVPTNENIPLKFELSQNYPNPFNPTTTIRFSINHSAKVTLKIYDILGREVTTLINKYLLQGRYEVVWSGEGNASGVYFYTLSSGSYTITKKMLLLR